MKKIFLFFAICLFNTSYINATEHHRNIDIPFVFIENNVEFAVFENGEFDFNLISPKYLRKSFNRNAINISFNSGYNYNPYLVKNRFGDIVQIENTSIYYDNYGRVSRIGNIPINYNRYGQVFAVGCLNSRHSSSHNNYQCNTSVKNTNHYYKKHYRNYRRPTKHHHSFKLSTTYLQKSNNTKQHCNNTSNRSRKHYKKYNFRPQNSQKRIRQSDYYTYQNPQYNNQRTR